MPDFTLSRFKFSIQLQKSGRLPPYKGSTIRGAVGHALREISCKKSSGSCGGCEYVRSCSFIRLFKPDQEAGKSIPSSYVINPPVLKETNFLCGADISFHLTLFGWASEHISSWIDAVKLCGEKYGLGAERIPFTLKLVQCIPLNAEPVVIFMEGGSADSNVREITFSQIKEKCALTSSAVQQVSIRLLTPLKLKEMGAVSGRITARLFIGALLRRLRALSQFYQTGSFPDHDYRGIAEQVTSTDHVLKWVTLERRSVSQSSHINLGGLTGSFTLNNLPPLLYPLLRFGEFVHVGKNTVYGCGKYKIVI